MRPGDVDPCSSLKPYISIPTSQHTIINYIPLAAAYGKWSDSSTGSHKFFPSEVSTFEEAFGPVFLEKGVSLARIFPRINQPTIAICVPPPQFSFFTLY